jgi:DNA helicase-2/ATP-dependent DNA helicase PcrA
MRELFRTIVVNNTKDIYFYQQYIGHLYEYRTFNEADLYQNGIIKERVHIMTAHKAKGLEFDNTLVYNVSEGIMPHYKAKGKEEIDESARVLYVAMSRAKKRLYITYAGKLSPFIMKHTTVLEHFYDMPELQKERLLQLESDIVEFS